MKEMPFFFKKKSENQIDTEERIFATCEPHFCEDGEYTPEILRNCF
jgi:hypothetical protein